VLLDELFGCSRPLASPAVQFLLVAPGGSETAGEFDDREDVYRGVVPLGVAERVDCGVGRRLAAVRRKEDGVVD
jgi:hypothetical protein